MKGCSSRQTCVPVQQWQGNVCFQVVIYFKGMVYKVYPNQVF